MAAIHSICQIIWTAVLDACKGISVNSVQFTNNNDYYPTVTKAYALCSLKLQFKVHHITLLNMQVVHQHLCYISALVMFILQLQVSHTSTSYTLLSNIAANIDPLCDLFWLRTFIVAITVFGISYANTCSTTKHRITYGPTYMQHPCYRSEVH